MNGFAGSIGRRNGAAARLALLRSGAATAPESVDFYIMPFRAAVQLLKVTDD
tara:strand:+ start:268 stop:423 length:156 start_codon:yes stop_codon:yes gene_type:complete